MTGAGGAASAGGAGGPREPQPVQGLGGGRAEAESKGVRFACVERLFVDFSKPIPDPKPLGDHRVEAKSLKSCLKATAQLPKRIVRVDGVIRQVLNVELLDAQFDIEYTALWNAYYKADNFLDKLSFLTRMHQVFVKYERKFPEEILAIMTAAAKNAGEIEIEAIAEGKEVPSEVVKYLEVLKFHREIPSMSQEELHEIIDQTIESALSHVLKRFIDKINENLRTFRSKIPRGESESKALLREYRETLVQLVEHLKASLPLRIRERLKHEDPARRIRWREIQDRGVFSQIAKDEFQMMSEGTYADMNYRRLMAKKASLESQLGEVLGG